MQRLLIVFIISISGVLVIANLGESHVRVIMKTRSSNTRVGLEDIRLDLCRNYSPNYLAANNPRVNQCLMNILPCCLIGEIAGSMRRWRNVT
jgi:hypothetical protein